MKYLICAVLFIFSTDLKALNSLRETYLNKQTDLGHKWVMFVVTITDAQKKHVYTTGIYNLKTKGLVHLQETINKMRQCLIADASKLHVSVTEVKVTEFKFSSYDEGEKYFKDKVVPAIKPSNFPESACALRIVADL